MDNKKKILTEAKINYSLLNIFSRSLKVIYLDLFTKILKRDEGKEKDEEKLFPEKTETIEKLMSSLRKQYGAKDIVIVTKENILPKIEKVKKLVEQIDMYLKVLDAVEKILSEKTPEKTDQLGPGAALVKTIAQLFENTEEFFPGAEVEKQVREYFADPKNQEKLQKLKNFNPLEDVFGVLTLTTNKEKTEELKNEIKLSHAYLEHGKKLRNTIKSRLTDDVADIEEKQPDTPEEFISSLDLGDDDKEILNAFKDFAKTYKEKLEEDPDEKELLKKFGISTNMLSAFIRQTSTNKTAFLRILEKLNAQGKAEKFVKFLSKPEPTEDELAAQKAAEESEAGRKAAEKQELDDLKKKFEAAVEKRLKELQKGIPLIIPGEKDELTQDLVDEAKPYAIDAVYRDPESVVLKWSKEYADGEIFTSGQAIDLLGTLANKLPTSEWHDLYTDNWVEKKQFKIEGIFRTGLDLMDKLIKARDEEARRDLTALAAYMKNPDGEIEQTQKNSMSKTADKITNTLKKNNNDTILKVYMQWHDWMDKNKRDLLKYFEENDGPQGPSTEEPKEEKPTPTGFEDFKSVLTSAKTGKEALKAYNKLAEANNKVSYKEPLAYWLAIKDTPEEKRNEDFKKLFTTMVNYFSRFQNFDTGDKNVREMMREKLTSLLDDTETDAYLEEQKIRKLVEIIKPYLIKKRKQNGKKNLRN